MQIDFEKQNGLVPAIVQDWQTKKVLMLGFMNKEAFEKTRAENKVTFFSRTKNRLWTKGESSGNFLHVKKIASDCDNDTLLIFAQPAGPVCHTGQDTCFGEENQGDSDFLFQLERVITDRKENPQPDSYTTHLFNKGMKKIAQKVGEEATELVIEAFDSRDDLFKNEAADLLYHLLVLLSAKGIPFKEVIAVLEERHAK